MPIPGSDDTLVQSIYLKKYSVQVSPLFIKFDDKLKEERIVVYPDTTIIYERWRDVAIIMHSDETLPVGNDDWTFMQVLQFIHTQDIAGIQTANQYMLYIKGY